MNEPPPPLTKDRILDAAEALFSDLGFSATSLRAITNAAHVNLAAVHYHFQSKEALLEAVIGRHARQINALRLAELDRLEAEAAGAPVPIEPLLEAFFAPVLAVAPHAPRLMVRMMYLEPIEVFRRVFDAHLRAVTARFFPHFHRALPHLAPPEILLRLMFVFGAFANTMAATQVLQVISEGRMPQLTPRQGLQQLIRFGAAGLRAPALESVEHA